MASDQKNTQPGSTRQRILTAAIKRFTERSYDETMLRDIAADVGVDVAYVHRSFGSKAQLFLEVLKFASEHRGLADVPLDQIAPQLSRQLFGKMQSPGEPDPLMILIRSLTTPATAEVVGDRLIRMFIAPIQQKLGDASPLRATMVMGLLIGLSLLNSTVSPAATNGQKVPEDTERAIALALQHILETPVGA
ncbi:MAG: TetR family transcriptional regulator [Paracoccus sp. (in: a-proteobacteria)]